LHSLSLFCKNVILVRYGASVFKIKLAVFCSSCVQAKTIVIWVLMVPTITMQKNSACCNTCFFNNKNVDIYRVHSQTS